MPTQPWPDLPYGAWKDTCATLHLWTQIVGKIRLALTPWLNHSWHVPLYVTARGLTTSPIPCQDGAFEMTFDFTRSVLDIAASDGRQKLIALEPRTVAEFYALVIAALGRSWPSPVADHRLALRDRGGHSVQPGSAARRL